MPIVPAKISRDQSAKCPPEGSPRPRVRKNPDEALAPEMANPATPAHENKRTGPNWNADGTYEVGKNKPPVNTRWKKGQSGNPRGPKKNAEAPSMEGLTIALMEQKIALTSSQGGKTKMSHAAALLRKVYEKAVKGDLKSAVYLFELYGKALIKPRGASSDDGLSSAEQAILANLLNTFTADPPKGQPA